MLAEIANNAFCVSCYTSSVGICGEDNAENYGCTVSRGKGFSCHSLEH